MVDTMLKQDAESSDPEKRAPVASAAAANTGGIIDAKHERHRCYTIIGKDDQEIVRTAGQLLVGSQLLANHDLIVANLISSFKRIAEWAQGHATLLWAVYITIRRGEASLFFVSSSERYDIDLDAQMTELEVELGGSAGIGSVESFQIPPRSIDQFVGPDSVLLWQR